MSAAQATQRAFIIGALASGIPHVTGIGSHEERKRRSEGASGSGAMEPGLGNAGREEHLEETLWVQGRQRRRTSRRSGPYLCVFCRAADDAGRVPFMPLWSAIRSRRNPGRVRRPGILPCGEPPVHCLVPWCPWQPAAPCCGCKGRWLCGLAAADGGDEAAEEAPPRGPEAEWCNGGDSGAGSSAAGSLFGHCLMRRMGMPKLMRPKWALMPPSHGTGVAVQMQPEPG